MATKRQIKKLMAENDVPGELSGAGSNWEVELPNDEAFDLWNETVGKTISSGGYRSGFGSWVLSPNYQDRGDWNDRCSAWHY